MPPAVIIRIEPRHVFRLLLLAIGLLLVAHAIGQVARLGFGRDYLFGFVPRFYFGSEASVPAWFTASVMLLCGVALGAAAAAVRAVRGANSWMWAILAIVFVALSMDEASAIHELSSPAFADAAERAGLAGRYGWVLLGAPAAALFGLLYLRFLLSLPRRTAMLFVTSGVIFVAGAVGAEALGGRISATHGAANALFVVVLTIEETLEMLGVSLFLYAVLEHLDTAHGELRLRFTSVGPAARTGDRPRAA